MAAGGGVEGRGLFLSLSILSLSLSLSPSLSLTHTRTHTHTHTHACAPPHSEPEKCTYAAKMTSPAVCEEEDGNTKAKAESSLEL